MRLGRSTPEARENQRIVHVNGHDYVLSEFVGAAPLRGTYVEGNEANGNALPQGFLVEQPPGSVTPPHFHETDQFQVFVGGSGRMGKQQANPVAVHYAGGHTPYGPIAAGNDGVQYFTLRRRWDPGAKYMPASRDRLRRGPRRHRLAASAALTAGRAGIERRRDAGLGNDHAARRGRPGGVFASPRGRRNDGRARSRGWGRAVSRGRRREHDR